MPDLNPKTEPELVPPTLRSALVGYVHKLGKHVDSLGDEDRNSAEALMGGTPDLGTALVELVHKGEGDTPESRDIHLAASQLIELVSARDLALQHTETMEKALGDDSPQALDAMQVFGETSKEASFKAVKLLQLVDGLVGKQITKDPTTVVKAYLHGDEVDISSYARGLSDAAGRAVASALYEVEFEIEVDDEGKKATIIRVDGRDLAPEKSES